MKKRKLLVFAIIAVALIFFGGDLSKFRHLRNTSSKYKGQ